MLKKIGLGASALALGLGLAACSNEGTTQIKEIEVVSSVNEEVVVDSKEEESNLEKISHELVDLTIKQKGRNFYLEVNNKTDEALNIIPDDMYINDNMGLIQTDSYLVKAGKAMRTQLYIFNSQEEWLNNDYAPLAASDVVGMTIKVSDEGFQITEDIEIEFTVE